MSKRILMFGLAIAILVTSSVFILRILDVVTMPDAGRALIKTVSVVVVATTTIVLMSAVLKIGKRG